MTVALTKALDEENRREITTKKMKDAQIRHEEQSLGIQDLINRSKVRPINGQKVSGDRSFTLFRQFVGIFVRVHRFHHHDVDLDLENILFFSFSPTRMSFPYAFTTFWQTYL